MGSTVGPTDNTERFLTYWWIRGDADLGKLNYTSQ
jgi:hypothetical protein